MSKRFIVLLVAAVALVFASSASAVITIQQAPAGPGNYQNLTPFPGTTGACGGGSGGVYYLSPRPGVPNSGDPIRLRFGWGAKTESQMAGFFKNSTGSVTITGTDTFNDRWASTSGSPFLTEQGIQWSALAPQTLQYAPGSATVQGFSSLYLGFLSLAVGTYTLTVEYVFNKPVQDGFSVSQGTLSTTCTFTVYA